LFIVVLKFGASESPAHCNSFLPSTVSATSLSASRNKVVKVVIVVSFSLNVVDTRKFRISTNVILNILVMPGNGDSYARDLIGV